MSSARDAIIYTDSQGKILIWNAAAEMLFGCPQHDVLQHQIGDVLPVPVAQRIRNVLWASRCGDAPVQHELKWTRENGKAREAELTVTAVCDEAGRKIGAVVIAREITEGPHSGQTYRRLVAILQAAGIATWEWDVGSGAVRFSDEMAVLHGISPAELGSTFQEWSNRVHPADRWILRAALERAVAERAEYNVEYRTTWPDGIEHRIACRGQVNYDAQGTPTHLLGVALDVTERKRTEDVQLQLASIVESSADAIIGKDMDGVITSWNKGAEHIYGYTAKEMVGKSIALLMPPERPNEFPEIMERLRRGEHIDHYETRRRTRDGSIIEVAVSISPIVDHFGHVIGASSIARDITEHKRAEEALRNSERLAATGRLAASIAHEINNPLESVTNLLYLLEQQANLDEQARSYLSLAGEELARIVHITRQTLGFYRETAVPTTVNIAELLDSVLELYGRKIQSNRITVERRYGRNIRIHGFPGEIRQVFSNLVVNALEATSPGGSLRLHAYTSRDWRRPSQTGIRVIIADNGPGIPPENRRRIFDPFYTTKGERGTGLGLWVTSGIVRKHGGSIRVRSSLRPGCSGTVFSVFLPGEREPAASEAA